MSVLDIKIHQDFDPTGKNGGYKFDKEAKPDYKVDKSTGVITFDLPVLKDEDAEIGAGRMTEVELPTAVEMGKLAAKFDNLTKRYDGRPGPGIDDDLKHQHRHQHASSHEIAHYRYTMVVAESHDLGNGKKTMPYYEHTIMMQDRTLATFVTPCEACDLGDIWVNGQNYRVVGTPARADEDLIGDIQREHMALALGREVDGFATLIDVSETVNERSDSGRTIKTFRYEAVLECSYKADGGEAQKFRTTLELDDPYAVSTWPDTIVRNGRCFELRRRFPFA